MGWITAATLWIGCHLTHLGWVMQRVLTVIPGGCEASNPESRDSGSGPSDNPGMTKTGLLRFARNDGGRHSPPAISAALPPAAAVFTVTVCSVAKRDR